MASVRPEKREEPWQQSPPSYLRCDVIDLSVQWERTVVVVVNREKKGKMLVDDIRRTGNETVVIC